MFKPLKNFRVLVFLVLFNLQSAVCLSALFSATSHSRKRSLLRCGALLSYHTFFRLSSSFFKFFRGLPASQTLDTQGFSFVFSWVPLSQSDLIILPRQRAVVKHFFLSIFVLAFRVPPLTRDSFNRIPNISLFVNRFFTSF